MSAFMVDSTHIDAMLTAGLQGGPNSDLSWFHPAITEEDRQGAYQAGEPWGPTAIRLAEERRHHLTRKTAGRVGAMLMAENRASVNHRYNEEEWEEPYTFRMLRGHADPVVILSALSCYEYQSCEHPEWEASEAHAFCEALRDACIGRLPGWGKVWEITDRNIFA